VPFIGGSAEWSNDAMTLTLTLPEGLTFEREMSDEEALRWVVEPFQASSSRAPTEESPYPRPTRIVVESQTLSEGRRTLVVRYAWTPIAIGAVRPVVLAAIDGEAS
jgi:hypothetical protein